MNKRLKLKNRGSHGNSIQQIPTTYHLLFF